MKIYIVRHGRTKWIEEGRTQGRRQNRLNGSGILGVERTADKLKGEKIDVIYSSPLMRAIQTAKIVNRYHNVEIKKCELLTEIDQGVFTGRIWRNLTDEEKELKNQRLKEYGMESLEEVATRVKKFKNDVIDNCSFENILVVSHGNVCTMLESILVSGDVDFEKVDEFANSEVKEFEVNNL